MPGFNPDQQLKKRALKKKGVDSYQQNSAPNLNAENPAIAGGGLIQGQGTGTSDDIQMQMPAGSYIMPADSTEQIGAQGLAGLGSPTDVNVSNGEYQLPPEQVHAVGVQVLDQMKGQTSEYGAKGFKPNVNRDGEQFFNQGGVTLGEEEAKRKAAQVYGQAPMGIGLTPQQIEANRRADQRRAGAQTIQQTKQNIGEKVDAVGGAVGMAWDTVKQYPKAGKEFVQNTTFDNRLPGQADRDAKRAVADKARASQWAATNPEQAQQAGLGIQGVADRATAGANIPPKPLQGIGGAPMPAPQQVNPPAPTQQPQVDPVTGQTIAPQPVAEQGVVTQPDNEPVQSRHGQYVSRQQPKPDPETGYVTRTDQQRRDFARSNKVDGVPMLDSNMAKTINPASINTMGAQAMMNGVNPQTSQALSGALSAAAKRGDWDAVNRHYQSQGQSFAGMGAGGLGGGNRGAQFTVVRDPTRMPSNAELMNQRMESAQMRNADAGRKTDIEAQRIAAGIDSDQFRNSILGREAGIAERNQDLAERQAEPTIAQQLRLQSLYEQYDQADDAGKKIIAQQIQDLTGKPGSIKDNFLTAGGGQEWDSQGGLMRNVPQRVIDLRTGQEIGSVSQKPAQKAPAAGEVRGQYRFKGGNPADQKNWEKI